MRTQLMFVAALAVAGAAQAQIVMDGTADAAYGKPIAIQNTQTQFGDAIQGTIDYAQGSEIDALYAKVQDGILYLVVAGNLESNFNKLEIFIDGVAGGQNRLRGNNPDVDFNGINRMGDDGTGNGLTFDAAFAPDLWVSLTCGGGPFAVYMNQAQLLTKGGGTGGYLGTGGAGATGAVIFKNGFGFGINNSNIAGVPGGTNIGSGAGVSTGVEVRIPLTAIPGYTSGDQFLFNVRLSENNLFGRGQRAILNADFGSIRRNIFLSYTEPYLFDTRLLGQATIFNTGLNYAF